MVRFLSAGNGMAIHVRSCHLYPFMVHEGVEGQLCQECIMRFMKITGLEDYSESRMILPSFEGSMDDTNDPYLQHFPMPRRWLNRRVPSTTVASASQPLGAVLRLGPSLDPPSSPGGTNFRCFEV